MALTLLLTGCATGTTVSADEVGGSDANGSAPPTEDTVVDDEAEAIAQSWLDGAVLPAGAVVSETSPASFLSYYDWPCEPMVERTGYWTVAGSTVAETTNWLRQNPIAGLEVTTPGTLSEDTDYDEATTGNASAYDSLEGIAYTVTRTADGVAIRAEVGVIPEGSVCPEGSWGGPGQG